MRAIGSVLLFLGLAAFGVLSWALRKVTLLERGFDAGDVVVLGVLAVFGSFCAVVAWRIFRITEPAPVARAEPAPPRRVTVSKGFATAGGCLLMASVFVPEHWYPVVLLFAGLAALAVSHVLTPCEERIAKLRKARASVGQL